MIMKNSVNFLVISLAIVVVGGGCAGNGVLTDNSMATTDALTVPSAVTDTGAVQPAVTQVDLTPTAPIEQTTKTMLSYQGVWSLERLVNKQVRITTTKGDIVVGFYPTVAPIAVTNFIYLAENNFYDGIIFHRVIKDFMIQGGDPTGTGTSGPGYKFPDELNNDLPYKRGALAMANSGPNTNGSQFFIMHQPVPLGHDYTIFGEVISGLEVIDAIASTPTDGNDRPITEIRMLTVTVETVSP